MKPYCYPWPASALDEEDMAALYHARESDPGRKPITALIREAVQAVGGNNGHEETPSEKPDAEAAPESVQDNEGDETKTPTRKETNRMIQPKKNDEIEGQDQTPDLWTQYQTVKERARELNSAIAELGQSIKGYQKDQKSVRVELDNARGVLAKLQSINI